MTGIITSYSPKHGYGFIDNDIYFHIKNWNLRQPPVAAMKVTFDIEKTEKGKRAVNIRNVF